MVWVSNSFPIPLSHFVSVRFQMIPLIIIIIVVISKQGNNLISNLNPTSHSLLLIDNSIGCCFDCCWSKIYVCANFAIRRSESIVLFHRLPQLHITLFPVVIKWCQMHSHTKNSTSSWYIWPHYFQLASLIANIWLRWGFNGVTGVFLSNSADIEVKFAFPFGNAAKSNVNQLQCTACGSMQSRLECLKRHRIASLQTSVEFIKMCSLQL